MKSVINSVILKATLTSTEVGNANEKLLEFAETAYLRIYSNQNTFAENASVLSLMMIFGYSIQLESYVDSTKVANFYVKIPLPAWSGDEMSVDVTKGSFSTLTAYLQEANHLKPTWSKVAKIEGKTLNEKNVRACVVYDANLTSTTISVNGFQSNNIMSNTFFVSSHHWILNSPVPVEFQLAVNNSSGTPVIYYLVQF